MRSLLFCIILFCGLSALAGNKNKAIRIRKLPLASFSDAESRQLLLRYLLSNPGWDVREERGKTFAYRRLSGSLNTTVENGYYTDTVNAVELRLLISFSGAQKDRDVDQYTQVENTDQKIKIPTARNKRSPKAFQSYLLITESVFTVEVYEASTTRARKYTAALLDDLNKELLTLLDRLSEIKEQGFLSETSRNAVDSVWIIPLENGKFLVNALYSFNRKGFVFVRLLRGDESLSGKVNRANSKRPVGWSVQGTHRFHVSTFVVNTETLSDRTVEATVELIFVDETGREERILKKERVLLSAFSR